MRARLRYYAKHKIGRRYVIELSIHEVGNSLKYPNGIKYGLMCKDLKTGRFVLLDNHHPKGPHGHVDEYEFLYNYINDEELIADFQSLVLKEFGVKL